MDKSAQDRLLQGAWKHADYLEEEIFAPPAPKRKISPLWFILLSIALVVSYVMVAHAHVPGHPEWDAVISGSINANGRSCCGQGDAHLVEFDEWEPSAKGAYRVQISGRWYNVPPRDVTENEPNPTGKALVWYDLVGGGVVVYCFKPLNSY